MNKRAILIGITAGIALVLVIASISLSGSSGLTWGLIGSGGGRSLGTANGLIYSIGQPVAGEVSNTHTLKSGFYLSTAPESPSRSEVFLPVLLKDASGGS
jgi:hypothetical protein